MRKNLLGLIPEENLINLYLRENSKKTGNERYFWGGLDSETGENLPSLVGNIVQLEGRRTKDRHDVIKTVSLSLSNLLEETSARERNFLLALAKQSDDKVLKNIYVPKLSDSNLNDWKTYLTNFHNCVTKMLNVPEDVKRLINKLRSKEFTSLVGGQISAFSSTKIKKENQSYDDFFKEMGKLLLVKNKNKKTFSGRAYTTKDISEITNFVQNYNFPEAFKDGIQSELENIFSSGGEQVLVNSINQIISDEFSGRVLYKKSNRDKSITANFEQRLKKTMLQIFRQFFAGQESKMIELTPADSKDPYNITLLLRPKLNEQEGTYTSEVSMKINEISKEDDTSNNKNKIFKIFFDYIKANLDKDLQKVWESKKEVIKKAIFQNINAQSKKGKFRSITSISNILEGYGESGIRGVLGEIAAALQFSYMGNTSITGSDTTKAGQISFDVVIQTLKGQFGIQVKNFNNFKLKDFYKTSFDFSNENEMDKYFGEEGKKKYWFLLANGQVISETKILSKDSLQKRLNDSFYNYTDNFLRINSMDMPQEFQESTGIDITSSDIFLIGSYIVPASFLIFLIYRKLTSSQGEYSFFELENKNGLIKPLTLKQTGNSGGIPIEKNLFNSYRLNFKGINAEITLSDITF